MLLSILIILQLAVPGGSFTTLPDHKMLSWEETITPQNPCPELLSEIDVQMEWKKALRQFPQDNLLANCMNNETVLELVDEIFAHGADSYYPLAQNIYFKVLEAESEKKSSKLAAREAKKVLPLLEEEKQAVWKNKIEQNNPLLAQELTLFWKLSDPIVSTRINEALTEHWVRVAHARSTFSKNSETVYGTDDRGTIYIKYGEPSFKRSGMLSLSNTEIRAMLYDLSYHKGPFGPREMFNLNMAIKQHYMPRYYEVWVYRNLGSRSSIIFIFGESAERGTFGLRKSVEEFIPRSAFRMGITSSWRFNTGARGLAPGPFLQMSLYNQLSTIDIFFGRQLSEYDQNWYKYLNGHYDFSSLKMMNRSDKAERELRRLQQEAPTSHSAVENNLNFIDQKIKTYRFLDEQHQPLSHIFISSKADREVLRKDKEVFRHQEPKYTLRQQVLIFDSTADRIYSDHKDSNLSHREKDPVPVSQLFELPASAFTDTTERPVLVLSSEIQRSPSLTEDSQNRVIASVKDTTGKLPVLGLNNPELEVSDLIWGYTDPEKQVPTEDLITFTIPRNHHIPKGKNFSMYFEAYPLKAGSDTPFEYQMEYSIHRVGRRKLEDTGISLTLNLSARQRVDGEQLEVETSELEAGTYRIICAFTSGQRAEPIIRKAEFEIVEDNN